MSLSLSLSLSLFLSFFLSFFLSCVVHSLRLRGDPTKKTRRRDTREEGVLKKRGGERETKNLKKVSKYFLLLRIHERYRKRPYNNTYRRTFFFRNKRQTKTRRFVSRPNQKLIFIMKKAPPARKKTLELLLLLLLLLLSSCVMIFKKKMSRGIKANPFVSVLRPLL